MSDLTHRDIITILDRLDLEYNQLLQTKVAFKQIKAVMAAYQEAKDGLQALSSKHEDLNAKIERLTEDSKNWDAEHDAHKMKLSAVNQEITEKQATLAALTSEMDNFKRKHGLA